MAATTSGDKPVSSNAAKTAVPDASHKLSAETNQIGMTGVLGPAERLALTTAAGFKDIPKGLYHAALNIEKDPRQIIESVVGSAVIGSALKTILPEAGPVGKVASVLMATWFIGESLPGFGHAYETGLQAKTWDEMHKSEQQFGDAAAQLGVNAGAGYIGYKIGVGATGKLLASEPMDGFADLKQNFYNSSTDHVKSFFGRDTTIPTASSVGLAPNYVIEGDRATLVDSNRQAPSNDVIGPLNKDADINTTVMLKSKASVLRMDRYIARKSLGQARGLTDQDNEFEKRFGSTSESLAAVTEFAKQHNLTVAESDLRSGRVFLTGKASAFQNAFSIKLNQYATDAGVVTGHDGAVSLPKDLVPHVRAVFGTDESPVATSSHRGMYKIDDAQAEPVSSNPSNSSPGAAVTPENFIKKGGYLATDIARVQNFPLRTGGEGQNGAFISLSGGIDLPDYNKFFPEHSLEQPRSLGIIEVDGAKNNPGTPAGADTENVLDATQLQSIAPKANINMILGPNSDQGLVDVVERGIFPRNGEGQNSALSSSWGLAENRQTPQAINTLGILFRQAVIRNMQIFAGAGDNGARANGTGYQPEYPASDPNVTGVGGLKMILTPDGKLSNVIAWDEGEHSSTGGGISKIFSLPYWQNRIGIFKNLDTGLTGRGSPDISTNGAKSTGYPVRVNGSNYVIGGTSAGAPLYTGLALNINAELAAANLPPVTPLNPWMYARANSPIFKDVDKGGNHGYEAGKGWDPVAGLGWVDGQEMLNAMLINQTIKVGNVLPFIPVFGAGQAEQPSTVDSGSTEGVAGGVNVGNGGSGSITVIDGTGSKAAFQKSHS
jgi:kumamolisin